MEKPKHIKLTLEESVAVTLLPGKVPDKKAPKKSEEDNDKS